MADTSPPFDNTPLPPGSRIACRVEYDGSRYNGWQAQPHPGTKTIQTELEQALAVIAGGQLRVHCAGRTDAGVHGFCQVAHFDAAISRSPKNWVMGTNANLPRDIRVHWAQPVAQSFHARFSALSRSYRYIIANTPVRPALSLGQLSWCRFQLDHELMHTAAQHLLGERDFSAFRAAACQASSPMREVQEVRVSRRGDLVLIDIRANAFLHHMVRNIAGSLIRVGCGRNPVEWIAQLLAGRDRRLAADTAAPDGLYMVDVAYPHEYDLPATPEGPLLSCL